MKKYPFETTFAKLVIRPMVSAETDKFLAIASLDEVSKFLPGIDTAKNHDLLPVAFNACVVNRVNKNTDIIDTSTALAMYKSFINKPINVEHNRQKVIGMILTAGFSAFGSDKPLSEEEASKMTAPFNITLGGIVWRLVSPDLADYIEASSDPTSDSYMEVSASWELGFTGYRIALFEGGKKNLSEATKIIDDPKEVESAQNKLIALGGDGKFQDLFAFRMPSYDVLPIGIGFTEKPAAEVKGVATPAVAKVGLEIEPAIGQPPTKEHVNNDIPPTISPKDEVGITNPPAFAGVSDKKKENIISHTLETNVKTERIQQVMKITSLQDISEASLKDVAPTAVASAVSEFISSELKKGSDLWEKQKGEFTNKLSTAETSVKEAKDELVKVTDNVGKLTKQVESLSAEKLAREQVELFNGRMSEISEAYELDDEARSAIVEDIKAIASDEDFKKWQAKAKILLKGYAKKAPPFAKKGEEGKEEEGEESCSKKKAKAAEATEAEKEAKAKEAVAAFVEAAKEAKGGLPNGSAATQTLREKAQIAFARENVIVTK